jgi:hypothetical protein
MYRSTSEETEWNEDIHRNGTLDSALLPSGRKRIILSPFIRIHNPKITVVFNG